MNGPIQLLAIQMVSTPDIASNFAVVEQQLQKWRSSESFNPNLPTLVVLPECFAFFGGIDGALNLAKEVIGDFSAPIQSRCRDLARRYNIWLVAGTIPTECGHKDKFQASCLVFSPNGELVENYQKIHLFDVEVDDNTKCYRESDTTVAGQQVKVFDLQGITVGLAVCYDVRFAGLFQCLADKGAQIIVLPSAFTCPTGQAHWHSLIRARAIENQVYMVAPGQGGVHPNQRSTYGHSLIADPWGEIIAEHSQHSGQASGQGIGLVSGLFDPNVVASICANMPLKQHNRFKYELIDESICRE